MSNSIFGQDRREFLAGASALALTAAPGVAVAAAGSGEHQHRSGKHAALISEALHCIDTGTACAAHCIMQMRTGSTELLDCLVRVQELVTACEALVKFAAFDSEHLATYAKATIEVCETCEAECRRFEDLHQDCKNCADACVACIKECQKIGA